MKLIIVEPGVARREFHCESSTVNIGRRPDSDIVLVDDMVSGSHVELRFADGQWLIKDLRSTNGVFVNESRVQTAVLHDNDEILVGKTGITVEDTDSVQRSGGRAGDTTLRDDIERIAAEMESVGQQLSMIGKKPADAGTQIEALADFVRPAGVGDSQPEEALLAAGRAYRRLNALYVACRVASSDFDLMERLEAIMDAVMQVTEADRGFLMLRDEATGEMTACVARAMGGDIGDGSPSMSVANRAAETGEPVLAADTMADVNLRDQQSIVAQHIRSAMCVPLVAEHRVLGSVYVDARRPGIAFTQDDLELFAAVAAQSAMVIENSRLYEKNIELETKRSHLQRYLSPSIVEQIIARPEMVELGGTKRWLTTMFCDIRGFTLLTEQLVPDELVHLLNEYFTAMTEIIFEHDGTLDKYIGDEIMAVFGSPVRSKEEAERAVHTAVDMLAHLDEMRGEWRRQGKPELQVGIGIATGEAIAGNIGSPSCMGFTAIGDSVNTARRLCGIAEPNQIIICETTYNEIVAEIEAECLGPLKLKGKQESVTAHSVLRFKGQEAG